MASITEETMTKDTLTLGSTDLLALTETVDVTVFPLSGRQEHSYTWQSVNDPTVRPEHHDLSSKAFVFDCTATTRSPSFVQSVGRLKRCRCYADDIFTRKALRTYPKRMSRAKRKEARAREQRRRINDNQWWSKR